MKSLLADIFRSPLKITYLVIALQSLVHLALAPCVELSPDEAHYALYGLNLDWCYVDHPPLVGWLQAVALLVSDSDLSLRFFAIATFACLQLLLSRFCRELFPNESPWIGLVAVLLLNSSIMFQGLSFMLQPDSLIMLFGIVVARSIWRCMHFGSSLDWIQLGAFMGLAGLSKFTAALLVMTAILFLISENRWSLLRTAGPWIAILLSGALIAPVVIWNWKNDWLTFSYRYHHAFQHPEWEFDRFLKGQILQLIDYGPAVYYGGYISLVLAFGFDKKSSAERLLAFTALPVFVVCGQAAGYRVPFTYWTALGWLATIPLTARLVCREWKHLWIRLITGVCAIYSLVTLIGVHLLVFSQLIHFDDYEHPASVSEFYAWKEVSRIALDLKHELNLKHPGQTTSIFVHNWSLGSKVAWYARPSQVQILARQNAQFDIWFGSPTTGASGILIAPRYMGGHSINVEIESSLARFERTRKLTEYSAVVAGGVLNTFDFYECDGFRG